MRKLKFLDVGAGSGILVESALNAGMDAHGIEPSSWLVNIGKNHGLRLVEGVLPHPEVNAPFDLIALVDVIEHVTDPLELLIAIRELLKSDGVCFIVTPDASSFFAKMLGFRWWHYRIAHVTYFNMDNFQILARRAGLEVCFSSRPSWYFSYSYLRERLCRYFPSWIIPPATGIFKNLIIPLNLRDSLLLICRRVDNAAL